MCGGGVDEEATSSPFLKMFYQSHQLYMRRNEGGGGYSSSGIPSYVF